jgi:hypothetical protein
MSEKLQIIHDKYGDVLSSTAKVEDQIRRSIGEEVPLIHLDFLFFSSLQGGNHIGDCG